MRRHFLPGFHPKSDLRRHLRREYGLARLPKLQRVAALCPAAGAGGSVAAALVVFRVDARIHLLHLLGVTRVVGQRMIELTRTDAVLVEHRKAIFDRRFGQAVGDALAQRLRQLVVVEHVGHFFDGQDVFLFVTGAAGHQQGDAGATERQKNVRFQPHLACFSSSSVVISGDGLVVFSPPISTERYL